MMVHVVDANEHDPKSVARRPDACQRRNAECLVPGAPGIELGRLVALRAAPAFRAYAPMRR